MTQYQIIVNPHEVVGRSRSASQTSSTSKTVLLVAVIGCAAVACVAISGLDSSASAPAGLSLAEAKAALSVRAVLAAQKHMAPPQPARVHFSARAQAPAASVQKVHAIQTALAKQALDEEAAPAEEAPAAEAAGAPAAEAEASESPGSSDTLEAGADSEAESVGASMGFNLKNEDKCEHKLANGKCAPKLAGDLELSPLASLLLIILVTIPAFVMVVIWAREPVGIEGLMQNYKYKEEEMMAVTPAV